jgi:hypothetical protein
MYREINKNLIRSVAAMGCQDEAFNAVSLSETV